MFKLVIQDDEGKTTVVPLIRDEITIGRKEGNTIRLTERNVSRRHARILRANGEVQIEDLGSYNGIRVNNARIAERVSLRVSDQVQIGDYKLYLKAEGVEQVDDARTMPIERVDAAEAIAAMGANGNGHAAAASGAPTAPASNAPTTPIEVISATSQMVGSPNRTMVAMGDAEQVRAAVGLGPATQQAVAAMKATVGYGRLVVVSSNFAGKEFELSRPQMIIGRTDENDIVINHRSISRNHAKVVREPETGRYTISDLQSSNGVRVNGQDYGKVELRKSDTVDLGHVRLRFVEPGEDFDFKRDAIITDVPESGSKKGMVIAIALGIAVLASIGIYMATRGGGDKSKPGPGSGELIATPGSNGANSNGANTPPTPGSNDVGPTPGSNATANNGNDNGSNGSNPNGSNGSAGAMIATPIDAGASTVTPNAQPTDEDRAKKRAECQQFADNRKWQDLMNCSDALAKLGDAGAADFKAHAKTEQANEVAEGHFEAALGKKDYGEAKKQLDKIDDASVFKKDARARFDSSVKGYIDDMRGRAKAAAKAGKCKDVDADVRAVANVAPDQADSVRVACTAVAAVPDHPDHPQPEHPNVTPPPSSCDGAALAQRGKDEINTGLYAQALNTLEQAIHCQNEPALYRLILLAACNSHNGTKAKQYFAKLPTSQQSAASQMCIRNGIPLP